MKALFPKTGIWLAALFLLLPPGASAQAGKAGPGLDPKEALRQIQAQLPDNMIAVLEKDGSVHIRLKDPHLPEESLTFNGTLARNEAVRDAGATLSANAAAAGERAIAALQAEYDQSPYLGPPLSSGGDDAIIRYVASPGVPLRSGASADKPSLGSLQQNEWVQVMDLFPSQGLQSKFDAAKKCFETGVGCKDLVSTLANGSSINYYAKVFVPRLGKEGYVPVTALFVRPMTLVNDRFVIQAGFGLLAKALRTGITSAFSPPGCASTPANISVSGYNDPKWWVASAGQAFSCSQGLACAAAAKEEQENGEAKVCAFTGGNCAACMAAQKPGYQSNYEECVENALKNGFDPKAACEGVSYTDPWCDPYVGWSQTKSFANPRDYDCGEYPMGKTHFDKDHPQDKALLSFWLWDEFHSFRTRGKAGQQDSLFTVNSLTAKGNVERSTQTGVGPHNLWVNLQPEGSRLRVEMCVRLPGLRVTGPNVDYVNANTPKRIIDKIYWGTLDVDRIEACMVGRASIDKMLKPAIKWDDVTQFKLVGASLDGFDVKVNPAYVLGSHLLPGIGGQITALLVDSLLVAKVFLLNWLSEEHNIDLKKAELTLDKVAGEAVQLQIMDTVLEEANNRTDAALADNLPDLKARLTIIKNGLLHPTTEKDPHHFFYQFLRQHLDAIVANPSLVPFAVNQSSSQQGCYTAGRYFTPADAAANPSPWWGTFQGQSWYNPPPGLTKPAALAGPETGCRLDLEAKGALDRAVWPVVQCSVATFNQWANTGMPGSLGGQLTTNCSAIGLHSLMDLYGNGKDLLPIIEKKKKEGIKSGK